MREDSSSLLDSQKNIDGGGKVDGNQSEEAINSILRIIDRNAAYGGMKLKHPSYVHSVIT